MTANEVLLACIFGTLALNVVASVAVALSSYFSRRQKAAQICVVWLIPILGGIFIGLFLVAQGSAPRVRTNTVGATDLDHNAIQLQNATQRGL